MMSWLIFFSLLSCANAGHMVSYFGPDAVNLVNTKSILKLDSLNLADIYARFMGFPPLFREDKVDFPTLNTFSPFNSKIVFVQYNGDLPENTLITGTTVGTITDLDPTSVVATLSSNGIVTNWIQLDTNVDLTKWLSEQTQPVLLVSRDPVTEQVARSLQSDDIPISEFEISQYQICLWTAVAFVLLTLASVCTIVQMEVIPDSLLYAKFQSGRTGKIE